MYSDASVKNAKPRASTYKLPREQGLFLVITPRGTKLWRFAYTFEGREGLLSLGQYPDTPLKLARERRDEARRQVAAGVNPSAARKETKARKKSEAVNTFRATALEWLAHKESTRTEATTKKLRWLLDDFLLPGLGNKPLAQIQPRDILAVLRPIGARGRLETMHRAKSCASEVFRFAIRHDRATSDPCRDLVGVLDSKRPVKHHAALTDPREVAELVRAVDGYTGTPEVLAALKLGMLLFVRPGELRRAQWPEFDIESDAPAWRFLATKTKTHHVVPLSAQAVEILRSLRLLTDCPSTVRSDLPRYVFPSVRSRSRPMSENTLNAALRRLGYTHDQQTSHGFRAMARTLLAELGWPPAAIEIQLAHKPSGPLGAAYDRAKYLDERRRMMTAWADYLDRLRAGETNVVPIRRAA